MLRKIHGAPDLDLDETMSKEAQEYAMKLAEAGKLEHAKTKYGENLAQGCDFDGKEISAEEATRMW